MANERELAEFIYSRLDEVVIDGPETAIATIESAINEFNSRGENVIEPTPETEE